MKGQSKKMLALSSIKPDKRVLRLGRRRAKAKKKEGLAGKRHVHYQ